MKVVKVVATTMLFFLVMTFLFISCIENRVNPEAGLKTERRVVETDLVNKIEIDFQLDEMLVYDDKLFFFEFLTSEFHIYNKNDLSYRSSFGSYGDAPFEYRNVVRYEIKDSIITTYDNHSSLIKEQVIGKNNVISLKKVPLDFISFAENKKKYLVSSRVEEDMRLSFLKMSKDFNTSNPVTIPEKYNFPFSALSYNGYFIENEKNKIHFVFETDHFLVFDESLEFKEELPLIYKTQTPLFTKTNEGVKKDDNSKEVNIHGKVYGNKLLILSAINSKEAYYIDVYDLEKMEYVHSYGIPLKDSKPREFVVEEDMIYVSNHEMIAKFEINDL
ncbi:MAG: hypothetical protein ACQESK_03525 [Bacteroidota bacterium]